MIEIDLIETSRIILAMGSISFVDHGFLVTLVAKFSALVILWLLVVVAWPKIVLLLPRRRKMGRLASSLRLIHDPKFKKRLYHISTIDEEPSPKDNSIVFHTPNLLEDLPLSLR